MGPSLNILDDKLDAIDITQKCFKVNSKELPVDWGVCVNIQRTRFYNAYDYLDENPHCSRPSRRSIVSTETEHSLKFLDLVYRYGGKEEIKKTISLIAQGTGALEAFKLECRPYSNGKPSQERILCPIGTFGTLVENNKKLHDIFVKVDYSDVIELLEAFLKSASLKKLHISRKKRMRLRRSCRLSKVSVGHTETVKLISLCRTNDICRKE